MNKKSTCSTLILLFLFVLTTVAAQAQTQISALTGNWMLDKEKTNTTKDFPEKLRNFKMMVSGTEAALNVKSQIDGNVEIQAAGRGSQTPVTESASRLGGRAVSGSDSSSSSTTPKINYGGTMAMFFTVNEATYNLNGEEVKIETKQGTVRVKAKLDKSGRMLQTTIIRPLKTPNGEMRVMMREVWKISEDGKSMKFQRTVEASKSIAETPDVRDEIVMVLKKVEE